MTIYSLDILLRYCKVGRGGPWWAAPPLPPASKNVPNGGSQGPMTAHFAGCHEEPPPPQSLTEGASQMPGTNDSTLRQLKPSRPSRIEKPISSPRHEPAAYPNLHPLAQPSLATCIYQRGGARGFPRPARFGSGTPPRSALPLKPVKHFLVCLVVFYLTGISTFRLIISSW